MADTLSLANARRLDDARLAPSDDLALAFGTIEDFEACDATQAEFQRRMLELIDRHPRDAHRRTLLEGHLTASALVLDARRERVLLTHHKKLGRWLQLGGHCDGDANLAGVALRECVEESGIAGLAILPTPVDLDIHTIPARPDEPEHLHYDTRFLVVAPEGAREVVSEESHALAWLTPAEIEGLDTDPSLARLVRLVLGC